MKFLLLISLSFFSLCSFAQSECAQSFNALSGKTDITLSWLATPNCTCGQVSLEWSTDSNFYNPFATSIYSTSFPAPPSATLSFQYDHTTPDLSNTNYYRLNLGGCGYSKVVGIRVGGLNYLFYPNPVNSSSSFIATIVFQNPYNNYYNLYIFDHNGQLIRKTGLFAGTTYQFSTDGLQSGLYLFVIASETSSVAAAGKFYMANN